MTTPGAITVRRLRAPRRPGEALIAPPLSHVAEMLAWNRRLDLRDVALSNSMSLAELATVARRELLQAAWSHTSRYADLGPAPTDAEDAPILLSGHQPQLFHAGVWFKNFLLAGLARRHAARSINLLIDNDLCGAPAIRVPSGPVENPRVVSIAFDGGAAPIPYEERRIVDAGTFARFPRDVKAASGSLLEYPAEQGRPIVDCLWPEAMRAAASDDNLGRVLAQARHRLELRWGLNNWEVPLSQLCRGQAFRQFSLYLLAAAGTLRLVYNQCLGEYRRANRIRSRAHPVPALNADQDWIETPFWIWHARQPRRRGLYARAVADRLQLSDRRGWSRELPLSARDASRGRGQPDGRDDWSGALQRWEAWEQEGTKLRPRALMTTLFARLMLSDLFVHGIGGGKYDELTDAILERFFGFEAPRFLVATATVWLPLPCPDEGVEQRLRETQQHLRALRYHPEAYLRNAGSEVNQAVHGLLETKRRWIETPVPPEQLAARHQAIEASNRAMQPYLADRREQLLQDRERLRQEVRTRRLLTSREFSYCLFPEKSLRRTLLELSGEEP